MQQSLGPSLPNPSVIETVLPVSPERTVLASPSKSLLDSRGQECSQRETRNPRISSPATLSGKLGRLSKSFRQTYTSPAHCQASRLIILRRTGYFLPFAARLRKPSVRRWDRLSSRGG